MHVRAWVWQRYIGSAGNASRSKELYFAIRKPCLVVKCNPPDPKYTWDSRVLTLVGGAVLYQNFIGMADSNLPETVNRYRYRWGGNLGMPL